MTGISGQHTHRHTHIHTESMSEADSSPPAKQCVCLVLACSHRYQEDENSGSSVQRLGHEDASTALKLHFILVHTHKVSCEIHTVLLPVKNFHR